MSSELKTKLAPSYANSTPHGPSWTASAIILLTALHGLGAAKRSIFGAKESLVALVAASGSLLVLGVCLLRDRRRFHSVQELTRLARLLPLVLAAALVTTARALSSLGAPDAPRAWSRTLLCAVGFAIMLLVAQGLPAQYRPFTSRLAKLGRCLLYGHGLLLGGGVLLLAGGYANWPFVTAAHQHAGALPRFYGLGINPFYAGLALLTCAGLSLLEARRSKLTLLVLSALILSTFSFITLLLPLLWIDHVPTRTAIRRTLKALTVFGALTALYIHPLSLEMGSRVWSLGELHAGYAEAPRGSAPMTVWARQVSPWGPTLTAHATAYYYLAEHSVRCFLDNPWLGTGPGNFTRRCPLRVMDTYGKWKVHGPHNQYFGLLAEEGLLGFGAWAFLGVVLVRRLRPSRTQASLLTLYALSGLACPVFDEIPFWTWIGWLLANSVKSHDHASLRPAP